MLPRNRRGNQGRSGNSRSGNRGRCTSASESGSGSESGSESASASASRPRKGKDRPVGLRRLEALGAGYRVRTDDIQLGKRIRGVEAIDVDVSSRGLGASGRPTASPRDTVEVGTDVGTKRTARVSASRRRRDAASERDRHGGRRTRTLFSVATTKHRPQVSVASRAKISMTRARRARRPGERRRTRSKPWCVPGT